MSSKEQHNILAKELAHFTRAIGHPARIAVLLAIAAKGEGMVRDIVEVPPLSRATVLQHLRELKRAGLILGKIYGAKTEYQIDFKKLQDFDLSFKSFLQEVQVKNS